MLALGLNIAVGWAGLLDLGYVAFFGFGAYGYALLSSGQLGSDAASTCRPTCRIPIVMVARGRRWGCWSACRRAG